MTNEREEIDPLEAELMALRPAEPSAGLHSAVGRRLSERSLARHVASWVAPAAAAAACVAVVAVALRHRPPGLLPPPTVRVIGSPATVPAPATDRDRPALANYRGAADLSPAELDELLGRHAARSLSGGSAGRYTASSGLGLSH